LLISDTTPDDAGQYTIVASNDGGTVSATVNVAVSVPEEVKVFCFVYFNILSKVRVRICPVLFSSK